jgi:protein-tyrosine phosphatase
VKTESNRHLKLKGAYNLRDVGGYSTQNGQRTKSRVLLRSETLKNLTSESRDALIADGLKSVIDLRGSQEVRESPNPFKNDSRVDYHHRDLIGDELFARPEFAGGPVTPGAGASRIVGMYRLILDEMRAEIQEVLAALASPDALPALIHCTAGKDRTGIIAALVLSLVGVDRKTIGEDYRLSAQFLRDQELNREAPSELRNGFEWNQYVNDYCPPQAIVETLEHAESRYGSVETYALGGALTEKGIATLRAEMVE